MLIKSGKTVLAALKNGGEISRGDTGWFLYGNGKRKRVAHRTVVSLAEKGLIVSHDKMASPIKLNYVLTTTETK